MRVSMGIKSPLLVLKDCHFVQISVQIGVWVAVESVGANFTGGEGVLVQFSGR
jgi:hypothetical protein